jgi:hypothetical protein
MTIKTVNANVRSGNTITVVLAGEKVGLLQSVRANDDYGPDAASGIGDAEAKEYVPGMARHSLSVSQMALKANSMRQKGITPENAKDVLKGTVFSIEAFDNVTGALLYAYDGVSFASGSVEITKHAIVVTDGQFNALTRRGTAI